MYYHHFAVSPRKFYQRISYRMAGVGREIWRSSCPTSLLQQFQLEQVAQDQFQVCLKYLQRSNSTTSPGSLFQCSLILKEKDFFLIFRWTLCYSLCLLSLVLLLGTTERSLPCLETPSLQIFACREDVHFQLSLLRTEQARLPQPFLGREMLQFLHHLCASQSHHRKPSDQQTSFPLGECIWNTPYNLSASTCLEMTSRMCCYHISRDSEADWPVVSWVLLPALIED